MKRSRSRALRLACIAALVACVSTSCATLHLTLESNPADQGQVQQAWRTSDGGLGLQFHNLTTGRDDELKEVAHDSWSPALVIPGTELDQILGQVSSESSDPTLWPRVLIARDRLKHGEAGGPVPEKQPETHVPVTRVLRDDWAGWPAVDAGEKTEQTPLSVAFATDREASGIHPRRTLAVLLSRDGLDGRRRAVLLIEPADCEPRLRHLAGALLFDALIIGLLALLG